VRDGVGWGGVGLGRGGVSSSASSSKLPVTPVSQGTNHAAGNSTKQTLPFALALAAPESYLNRTPTLSTAIRQSFTSGTSMVTNTESARWAHLTGGNSDLTDAVEGAGVGAEAGG
jgi:hypothetical protein